MIRVIWMAIGVTCVILGAIGLFLPFLPTAPFILVAAFCFSQGSPRLQAWLLSHPTFGPIVRDWQERGAIPRKAKWFTTVSCLAAPLISAAIGLSKEIIIVQCIGLAAVLLFVWTRPD